MKYTGVGKVWDNLKNTHLCAFNVNGVLDTEDPYVIKRMGELGYRSATSDDVVSVELCNGVNVDWRERYELSRAENKALLVKIAILKNENAKALEATTAEKQKIADKPILKPKLEPELVPKDPSVYTVNGFDVRTDFKDAKGVTELNVLKKFIKTQDVEVGDLRKYSKEQVVRVITRILKENEIK